MAKLIMFSDFLNSSEKAHTLVSLDYIANREGVEMNGSNRMYTESNFSFDEQGLKLEQSKKQEKLMQEIITKYPDLKELPEYRDYDVSKTMFTASVFITEALERLEELNFSNEHYMKYIAERPGVEMYDEDFHGLFTQTGPANLESIYNELAHHDSYVWRDIVSLRREDAIETGVDNREAWMSLLQNKMSEKAKLLGIPIENFKWCAAFHDEGHHPHVHVMSWDVSGKAGFQDENAIEKFKSCLANQIFSNEMWLAKEFKNEVRDEIEEAYKEKLNDLSLKATKSIKDDSMHVVQTKLEKVAELLNDKGSQYYGYQSQEAKDAINGVVSYMLNTKELRPLLLELMKSQEELALFYRKDTNSYLNEYLSKLITPDKNDRKVFQNEVVKIAYELKKSKQLEMKQIKSELSSLSQKISSREILLDPSHKLDENSNAINLSNYSDEKLHELTVSLARVCIAQEMPTDQAIISLNRFTNDEERSLEILLDAKDRALSPVDVKRLNKAFDEKIETSHLQKESQDSPTETNSMRAVARLFSNFINGLASSANEHMKELRRMQRVRAEDISLIRRAVNKFKR